MIVFERLRYRNFLSTGNNFTEIQLDQHSSTLVVGQNGAGKSTMLDAMSFVLFGKPYRKINKPQLVNSVNEKRCLVEIEFRVNNIPFKVVRGIKPAKFEIWKEGSLMNQSSHNKEYQKILEQNILKLNHKSFHQIVVLGSSSFIPFMQLTANHRREVIEDLLDIGMFSKMNMILKEQTAQLKSDLRETEHRMDLADTKIDAQKKYIRDITRINKDIRSEKEKKIKERQKEIRDIQKTNKDLMAKILESADDLADQQKSLNREHMSVEKTINKMGADLRGIMVAAKFFRENDHCPSCEQSITDDIRRPRLKELKENAKETDAELKERRGEAKEIKERLAEIETRMKEVSEINREIYANDNLIESLQKTITSLQNEIGSLSDSDGDLSQAQAHLKTLEDEFRSLGEEKYTINDQILYNNVVLEMLKDTGVKTKIIKQYLPVMNKLINQYLAVLDFFVHFELDENFNETIRSRHRDIFTYDSFSEGEKQRIDLALLFTWRQIAKMKNSVATNLLVLDETFDSSLDQDGIDNLMKIIYTLGSETNVFVISHKGEILDGRLDSKLEFYKDKNFSKVR